MSHSLLLQVPRDFTVWTYVLILVIWFRSPVESQDSVHALSTVGPQDSTSLSTAVNDVVCETTREICDAGDQPSNAPMSMK